MEFPKSAPTNVHKIDGVLFVQWTVYVVDDALYEAAGRDVPAAKDAEVEHQLDHLQALEAKLRKEGHHVFLDRCPTTLWLFDLSGPSVKQEVRCDERKEYALTIGDSGCKKLMFGSLRASDLADPPAPETVEMGGKGQTSPKKFEGTNLQAFQANAFLGVSLPLSSSQATRGGRAGTPNLPQDNAAIYKRIISAISMSIYHALASKGACIPFAPFWFLSPGSASAKHGFCEVNCDSLFARPLSATSLNVDWLSSGTLVISSHPKPDSRWINTTNLHVDNRKDVGATEVDLIVLAPLGVCAVYKGYESTPHNLASTYSGSSSSSGIGAFEPPEDPTYVDQKSWKRSVAALLDNYGFEISSDTQWIWVLTSGSITENNRPNVVESSTHTILWPSHLCFCQVQDPVADLCDYSWAWERSGFKVLDPLADAESWFLGKNSRKQALEAQRRQTELETRTRAGSSSSDDVDSLSELFIGIRRSFDQQALSGIYPTPPDADRSQAINVMTVQDLDTARTPDERVPISSLNDSQEDSRDINEVPFISPDADMGLGEYDHLEGDDLFGDMNSDMFTANGITEADFNFFDQPASVYEAAPQAVLADEESPSYTTYMSSNTKLRQPSDENQESLPNKEMDVENCPYDGLPVKSTGGSHLVKTPVNYTESSLRQSPRSSGMQATIHVHHAVVDESPSNTAMEKFTLAQNQLKCQDISYRGIPFKEVGIAIDKKYGAQGRYEATIPSQLDDREPTRRTSNDEEIPTLGFVGGDGDLSDTEGSEETYDEIPINRLLRHKEELSAQDIMQRMEDTAENICRKRKRSAENDSMTCITPATQDPTTTREASELFFPSLNSLLSSFEDDHRLSRNRCSLSNPSRRATDRYQGSDQSFIQLAQIIAEQLTVLPGGSGSLLNEAKGDPIEFSTLRYRCLEDPLRHVLPRIFHRSEQCSLDAYLSIEEYPPGPAQVAKSASKPSSRKHDIFRGGQDPDKSTKDVFLIPPSNILVQRGNDLMEVSPTALSFWEQLGLEPSAGPKDVRVLCIYPESQMMRRSVEAFLENIGGTYQSMRLGNHNRRSVIDFADGLVPVYLDGSTIEETAGSLEDICERLGELLQYESDAAQPTIIYMINPFEALKAIPHLCVSFSKILEAYNYGSGTSSYPNDLVLKIIPISMLASKTTIALPPPEVYAQVAMEVYNQCPPYSLRESRSLINSHSLFQLAEPIPKTLHFSLTANPSTALAGDDVAYHLAYSWSSDGQWLSMALTNTCGSRHWTVSYCLGEIPAKWATFRAVAKEIWDTMLELLGIQWGAHRLFIVKDSHMAQVEIDTWVALAAQTESNPTRVVLVTVDPSPIVYYAGGKDNVPSMFNESECYATPAGTPLGSAHTVDLSSPITSSGWGHAPKAVDGPDTDPKARLRDKTDETWGTIAAPSYERSGEPIALASGFLIKRAGPVDDDGLVMMGVSIVYAENMAESLLKKALCMYRALGILAKARGITSSRSVLPWHVAVARKAREGLDLTMQWVGA